MTKKLLLVTTILFIAAFALMAAGVDGKWTYEQPGRQGGNPTTVTITLKSDGGSLTGNVSRPGRDGNAMETQISEGKVDGNNVSFTTKNTMGDREFVTKYEGTMSGDEIKFKVTRPGRDGSPMTNEITAKRSTT